MTVAIVQYNAGNTRSVQNALARLGVESVITDDPEVLAAASHVIFPGVGEAKNAMQYLRDRELDSVLKSLKQPVLGICLGLQLFCEHSEEGNVDCLGMYPLQVKRFTVPRKVPHIGWNQVVHTENNLFQYIPQNEYFYFVHSYFAEVGEGTIGTAEYGESFSAATKRDNFYGVQFHPEKSGDNGEKLLKNFISL